MQNWKLIVNGLTKIEVSSAYWYEEAYCGNDINMSFIYIANSVGERTLPCGTPILHKLFTPTVSLTLIWMDLLFKKWCIIASILPLIPISFNLKTRPFTHTESKAFWRSINKPTENVDVWIKELEWMNSLIVSTYHWQMTDQKDFLS